MRGGVGGLAGVEGEDLVGSSPLELPLRQEQGGPGVGAGDGPLLPVADHAMLREHLRDPLGEGAREQLHVQLAQGYGLLVFQLGRARDLRAEPKVRISPAGRWEWKRSHWTGVGRALLKLPPRGWSRGPCHRPCPVRTVGPAWSTAGPRPMLPQGPRAHVGRGLPGSWGGPTGVGDPHLPETRGARGFHLDCSSQNFPLLEDVLGLGAQEVFHGALAVSHQERALLADVLL